MATDLYCPNCHENLGKNSENSKHAYCSTCGKENINNPAGHEDDDKDEVIDASIAEGKLPYHGK
jgi:hypothetical protein